MTDRDRHLLALAASIKEVMEEHPDFGSLTPQQRSDLLGRMVLRVAKGEFHDVPNEQVAVAADLVKLLDSRDQRKR